MVRSVEVVDACKPDISSRLEAYNLFLNSSDQKTAFIHWLKGSCPWPVGSSFCLDIGSGDGLITSKLANYFVLVEALEPLGQVLNSLYYKDVECVYQQKLGEFNIKKKYDFVLLSHVTYFLNSIEFNILFDCFINKGVRVVVVEQSGNSFVNKFAKENDTPRRKIFSNHFIRNVPEGKYVTYTVQSHFSPQSYSEALIVLNYMASSLLPSYDKDAFANYVLKSYSQNKTFDVGQAIYMIN